MKVKEVIQLLQQFDPELLVMVDDSEYGLMVYQPHFLYLANELQKNHSNGGEPFVVM